MAMPKNYKVKVDSGVWMDIIFFLRHIGLKAYNVDDLVKKFGRHELIERLVGISNDSKDLLDEIKQDGHKTYED